LENKNPILFESKNKGKSIGIFSNSFWNLKNFRRDIIEKLYREGYKVVLIYPYADDVHKLDFEYCKHIVLHELKVISKSIFADYKFYNELYKVLVKFPVDLLLCFTIKPNIYGSIISKKLGISCISTVTGLGKEIIKGNLFSQFLIAFYKRAVMSNTYVVFHNVEDLNSFSQKANPSNYMVINGSGVNTEIFCPMIDKVRIKSQVFLFSGRLIKSKGILEYLEAARIVKAEFPQIEFWIIGKHSEEELDVYNLLNEYQELGIIVYKGFIEYPVDILHQVTALVLPSYREGKSKSILEAMSLEIPVICSDVPGCHDLIKNGWNGFLVNPKDTSSLVHSIKQVIEAKPIELSEMGKRSRSEVLDHYDVNIISSKYLQLVESIVG